VTAGVVVAGASVAGLRTAESLRAGGYTQPITVLSAEEHVPYDRPPLSKQLLTGAWPAERVRLPVTGRLAELGIDVRYQATAESAEIHARRVRLRGGEVIEYESLVIATGARPRTLPWAAGQPGVHLLRSLTDALGLAAALRAGQRVVVVGAGFIGAEVASAARDRGCAVTVLEAGQAPLQHALGPQVGAALGQLHADNGVQLRTRTTVHSLHPAAGRQPARLVLDDGSELTADVVVVGVGARPNTDWLAGSGLTVRDGVVCDEYCRAAPGVFAAGDVARWAHPVLGSVRLEHWTNAREQGAAVAANILCPGGPTAYAPVPYVWSDHYGHRLQLVGQPTRDTTVRLVLGDLGRPGFAAVYARGGRVVGAVGLDAGPAVIGLRPLVAAQAPVEKARAAAAGS